MGTSRVSADQQRKLCRNSSIGTVHTYLRSSRIQAARPRPVLGSPPCWPASAGLGRCTNLGRRRETIHDAISPDSLQPHQRDRVATGKETRTLKENFVAMAETHLARAHDMYNEERYILAGHHLELALAGAYLVRTHSVNQTITRPHRVCVCVCVCVCLCVFWHVWHKLRESLLLRGRRAEGRRRASVGSALRL